MLVVPFSLLRIRTPDTIIMISTRYDGSTAIDPSDYKAYSWGLHTAGSAGNNQSWDQSQADVPTPYNAEATSGNGSLQLSKIAAGDRFTVAIERYTGYAYGGAIAVDSSASPLSHPNHPRSR